MGKLVFGIGFNDRKYPTKVDGKHTNEYSAWQNMLLRCTPAWWSKHPTYTGVSCSDNFKSYSFFYEWCQTRIGFYNKEGNERNWQLDKDILLKGNKVYNEDICVFVPQKVNKLIVKGDAVRGEYPVGVYLHKHTNKFMARCSNGEGNGKSKYLGVYDTYIDAFNAYKTFKEKRIKAIAGEYKNELDVRAYQALINYEVNLND